MAVFHQRRRDRLCGIRIRTRVAEEDLCHRTSARLELARDKARLQVCLGGKPTLAGVRKDDVPSFVELTAVCLRKGLSSAFLQLETQIMKKFGVRRASRPKSHKRVMAVATFAMIFAASSGVAQTPSDHLQKIDYAADAKALDQLVIENYAYEDHWPGGVLPESPQLAAERAAVHDHDSLLHYAEDRIASLADHHAITGSSFKDSWAIVPTYADLWISRRGSDYVIDSVRKGSPAAQAGIVAGDR